MLSYNPNAIDLLSKNLYKIDWIGLSLNPNAIHPNLGFLDTFLLNYKL